MMSEYKQQGFIFSDDTKSPYEFAYNYQRYKHLISKLNLLRLKTATPPNFSPEYFATFCAYTEVCYIIDFKKPNPIDYGITQEQIGKFLREDRYVTATLLLKKLAQEKNENINDSRRKIVKEYNEKMETWKLFTNKGQKKHE